MTAAGERWTVRYGELLHIGLSLARLIRRLNSLATAERALADRIGYGQDSVNKWRRGHYPPPDWKIHEVTAEAVRYCREKDPYDMVTRVWSDNILTHVNHPGRARLLDQLYPSSYAERYREVHQDYPLPDTGEPRDPDSDQRLFPPHSAAFAEDSKVIYDAVLAYLDQRHMRHKAMLLHHASLAIDYAGRLVHLLPLFAQLTERESLVLHSACLVFQLSLLAERPAYSQDSTAADMLTHCDYNAMSDPQLDQIAGRIEHWLLTQILPLSFESALDWIRPTFAKSLALVCTGARTADLQHSERFRSEGMGSLRSRPALLAALLTLADSLAVSARQPEADALPPVRERMAPNEVEIYLRRYLRNRAIKGGNIRFHYGLPPDVDSISARLVVSGPMHHRVRAVRDILASCGVMVALDSEIDQDQEAEPLPARLRGQIRVLAELRLRSLLPILLGTDAVERASYHFTGLRSCSLAWSRLEGADAYRLDLFLSKTGTRLETLSTREPRIDLPDELFVPNEYYEWCATRSDGQVGWEGGIFWLLDTETQAMIDHQLTWYSSRRTRADDMMRARILAQYGIYEDAARFYRDLLEQGDAPYGAQARVELVSLYREIADRLNRLNKPSQADEYFGVAQTLLQEIRREF